MKLIEDAGRTWHRLWSVRLAASSVLINAADAGYQAWSTGQTPWRSIMVVVFSAAIGVSRLVVQEDLKAADNG
jgi:hypothetical protein